MTLGERILQYRTARSWSQEDLADLLDVSRQSVSKWETDASTPDLDKIVRLSEIFEVSLDQLVTGKEPTEAPPPAQAPLDPPPKMSAGQLVKTILGVVLLCIGFVLGIVLLLISGEYIAVMLYVAPLILCGVICLTVRRRTGLWCLWTLFFWLDFYLRLATGITWTIVLFTLQYQPEWNYMRLAIGWFMLIFIIILLISTAVSYRELRLPPEKQNLCKLAVLLAAALILCPLLSSFLPPFIVLYGLHMGRFLVSAMQLILLARAIVLGAAMLRYYKTQRGA